ncbi:Dcp1p-Dcp2p decapping enzyme complex alpha subunit [Thoreauomyces humboldtii]|nr:Dcp1p-Dcp2p decapping enzyme complex alpha subunit [Thoreauomyces humboldtii]
MPPAVIPQIPGSLTPKGQKLHALQSSVARLLGAKSLGFSGAQPISFTSEHLKELQHENYFVSEKADGIRCLMFTTTDHQGRGETFLIDRHNDYYQLDFGLPIDGRSRHWHFDTLVDGELVLDTFEDGRQQLWFLLFDCMAVDGKALVDRPYHKRLGHLREFILKPYLYLSKADPAYAHRQPFRMDLKALQLAYALKEVFDAMPTLKHKSDGIIFTSKDAKYGLGTCHKMLKWKPADENTVDFKIRVMGDYERPTFVLQLWHGRDEYSDHGILKLTPEEAEVWNHNPPDGRIVECRFDPLLESEWRFHRFRDDKAHANHVNTYEKIMVSIKDGVGKAELFATAPEIRARWKEREARDREREAREKADARQ